MGGRSRAASEMQDVAEMREEPVMDAEEQAVGAVSDSPDTGDMATGSGSAMDADTAASRERERLEDDSPSLEDDPEARQQIEEVTSEVLGRLIANMQVQVEAYILDDLRDGSLVFEIEGADAGLLIGRRGETLRDLQSIVRLLVGRRLQRQPNIIIDVEQYQDRRRHRLHTLADRAARDAMRSGAHHMEPMAADERRLVHVALADHPDVMTESEGEGDDRHVVVKTKD